MSQSATVVRVPKHALDGTAIYPYDGQNAIYYQPFDVSSTKYLAYPVQRAYEQSVPLASEPMRIFRLRSIVTTERNNGTFDSFRAEQRPNSLSLSRCARMCVSYLFCLTKYGSRNTYQLGKKENNLLTNE